jgi:hypothetical protein
MTRLIAAVERCSALRAEIIRKPPVVPVTDNYDRLFYEPDAIARSARYLALHRRHAHAADSHDSGDPGCASPRGSSAHVGHGPKLA